MTYHGTAMHAAASPQSSIAAPVSLDSLTPTKAPASSSSAERVSSSPIQ